MKTQLILPLQNKMPRHNQRGIGLTELMIAMALALFLMLGLGTMFYGLSLTNKNIQGVPGTTLTPVSATNEGLSGLQDSERMTMLFLGGAIHAAGYYPIQASNTTQFPFIAPATNFSPNQIISGISGGGAGLDSIAIRFQSDATSGQGWQGCSGQAVISTMYIDTFNVANNLLQCNENGTVYPLANGVAGLTIQYGVSTATGLKYLAASAVTTWSLVKSVNINVQFVNPLAATVPGQPATVSLTQTFALMNGT